MMVRLFLEPGPLWVSADPRTPAGRCCLAASSWCPEHRGSSHLTMPSKDSPFEHRPTACLKRSRRRETEIWVETWNSCFWHESSQKGQVDIGKEKACMFCSRAEGRGVNNGPERWLCSVWPALLHKEGVSWLWRWYLLEMKRQRRLNHQGSPSLV